MEQEPKLTDEQLINGTAEFAETLFSSSIDGYREDYPNMADWKENDFLYVKAEGNTLTLTQKDGRRIKAVFAFVAE